MQQDIEHELGTEFERNLYAAAIKNLEDKSNPLRLNNFSYALRELTRHILYRLAPDDNVIRCSWYKNETDKENGITRKQRSYYAVQGGLADAYVKDTLGLEVDEIHRNLVKAIGRLSKFTHIEPNTFGLAEEDVDNFVEETIESVVNLLSLIHDCRASIIDSIGLHIDSAVVDEALRETILELDELASHHFIEDIYTDEVYIRDITHEAILFEAVGSIDCELQWGSNSDVRRGDGAVLAQNFPFNCKLVSRVDQPDEIETIEGSLVADTSSWREGYEDSMDHARRYGRIFRGHRAT